MTTDTTSPPQDEPTLVRVEDDSTGKDQTTLERDVLDHLYYTCSKTEH
ncbi:MAG: hypothetical protein AAFS10_12005 [Myxococcota bacterium]